MKIPLLQGRSDPETYLEWERKVEIIIECHNYTKEQKTKLAVIEFTDYAIVWQDQLCTSRRRSGEPAINTWTKLMEIMRKRFVSNYYYRDLYQKFQALSQGSRSVEDYYKGMEVIMLRADVQEGYQATMAWFLNGL